MYETPWILTWPETGYEIEFWLISYHTFTLSVINVMLFVSRAMLIEHINEVLILDHALFMIAKDLEMTSGAKYGRHCADTKALSSFKNYLTIHLVATGLS